METQLNDEITSVNAIYDSDVLSRLQDSDTMSLQVPGSQIKLRLVVPAGYPEDAPIIVGPESSGQELKKGDASAFAGVARMSLEKVFRCGEPCMYDLIEEVMATMQKNETILDSEYPHAEPGKEIVEETEPKESVVQTIGPPTWKVSDMVTEKKSVFIARAAEVHDSAVAKSYVKHLTSTDKRAARATHNITAWRIRNNATGIVYRDCDDDGETAAGGRLLHLLELMDIWNVMVVVSRWYGGIHLGPDRFRIINSVAREAVLKMHPEDRPTVKAKKR